METPVEVEASTEPSAPAFSQVIFNNIPHSYPPSTSITCDYTLTAGLQPNSRDWVGIFKVGWSTAKDYHTFVWTEPSPDVEGQGSVVRQAVFKEYYLPKDVIEFYQFCYVDSTGQVRGASTPFCFKNTEEQSTEGCPDDTDLLVITTQEQVEQSNNEKAKLQKELDHTREENGNLRRDLKLKDEAAAILKSLSEQKEKEKTQLFTELEETKDQNQNLKNTVQQQQQEMEHLKEELLVQKSKQEDTPQQSTASLWEMMKHSQEKCDRAALKINQLKDELEVARQKVDSQSDEIRLLNHSLREKERELLKTTDNLQLLQVDLDCSEKEKENVTTELRKIKAATQRMEDIERENRRLSAQETKQELSMDELKEQCQSLLSKLQNSQASLAAEKEESRKARTKAERLDGEQEEMGKQHEALAMKFEQEQRKSNKFELQFKEALESIADKDMIIEEKEHMMRLLMQEKDELAGENQSLKNDIEGLRRAYSDLRAAHNAHDARREQLDETLNSGNTTTNHSEQIPDQPDHLYENIDDVADQVEESLVCRHCQESFPGITQEELEQHEQSHRLCPWCSLVCDTMEQSVFEDHVYSHEL